MELRFPDFDERERQLAVRLTRIQQICRSLALCVVACAGLIWFFVYGETFRPIPGVPPSLPLSLAIFSMILILLGSRLRSAIVRRAFPGHPGLQANPETVIAAYQKAALVGFVLLDVAALIGLVISTLSGSAFYGLVLCGAALLGMLARWPRASELDRLLRGRTRF